MDKIKLLKGAGMIAAVSMLSLSQSAFADANVTISGWANEGMTYADDGIGSDIVSISDNGNTLGTRLTFSGSTDLPNSSMQAGFEIILEPRSGVLGFGSGADGSIGQFDGDNGDGINVLGNSVYMSGGFGKITFGNQSMPTDNIAVLEDPSLTLWSSISPIFKGNGLVLNTSGAQNGTGSTWGDFLNCATNNALRGNIGIGIDCNGTYLRGVRYDLPAFGPVTIAIGAANDDVYDVAVKWKGALGGINGQVAIGYSINQSSFNETAGAAAGVIWDNADNLQLQVGLMDPASGIFGSIAYQTESMELVGAALPLAANPLDDDTDAYWLKVGVKRAFNSYGDTAIAIQYGNYNNQYGTAEAADGVNGSEVTRFGVEVNQYFGSRFLVYGVWENLSLDVDCVAPQSARCSTLDASDDLDTFTLGAVFFF